MEDLYSSVDKNLYKIEPPKQQPVEISPENLASGALIATFDQVMNALKIGKTKFDNTETGYILGLDQGTAKFYIGDTSNYLNWTGSALTISGTLTASTITGGTFQTAASGTRVVIAAANNSIRVFNGSESDPRVIIGANELVSANIRIVNPASSTLSSFYALNSDNTMFDLTNGSTADGVFLISNSAAFPILRMTQSANMTIAAGTEAYIYLNKTSTGAGRLMYLRNAGTGACLYIENNIGAVGSGAGLNIEHYSSGTALLITSGDVDFGGNRLTNLPRTAGAPSTGDLGAYGLRYDTTGNELYFNNNGTRYKVTFTVV